MLTGRPSELLEALVRDEPENRAFRYELATNLNDLGLIQAEIGEAEASDSYTRALVLYEDLVAADPREEYRQDLGNTLHNLANLDYQNAAAGCRDRAAPARRGNPGAVGRRLPGQCQAPE